MANIVELNIGDLETGLDRARQQTALLKSLGQSKPSALSAVPALDTIARDLEALAQKLRAQNDRATMEAAGVDPR